MSYPLFLTAVVAIIVTLYYAATGIISFRGSVDDKTFFLMGRTVSGRDGAASHAAATMSLATTFSFFLILGKDLGLSLLVAPASLLVGVVLFHVVVLPRLRRQGFFDAGGPSTLEAYLGDRTGSRMLPRTILIATCVTMLSTVVCEMFLSVQIFSIFLKESSVGLVRPQDAALVLVMLTAFAYTAFGGLKAVIATDVVQFRMMMLAMIVLVGWLTVTGLRDSPPSLTPATFRPAALAPSQGLLLPYPLLANMVVLNLLFTTCMLRVWMVIRAQNSYRDARRGVIRGGLCAALMATLLIIASILAFRSRFPTSEPAVKSLMERLAELGASPASATLLDTIGAFGVLPIFFAACLAAMLSTMDSALLPILQFLFVDVFSKKRQPGWNRPYWHVPATTFALLMAVVILYFTLFRWYEIKFVEWLYTLLGFAIASGPAILAVVIFPRRRLRRRCFRVSATIGVLLPMAIVASFSYFGYRNDDIATVQWGTPVAVLVGTMITLVGIAVPVNRASRGGKETNSCDSSQ